MSKKKTRWDEKSAHKMLDRADRARSDRWFAESKGINPQRLTWWRSRLGRPRGGPKAEQPAPAKEFVEVVEKAGSAPTVVEILLRNGRQLRVLAGADPAELARLADALERPC